MTEIVDTEPTAAVGHPYITSVLRRWPVIAAAAVLGALLGFVASQLATPSYESQASLYFSQSIGDSGNDLNQGSTYTQAQMLSFAELADSELVLGPVADQLATGLTATDLASIITVSVQPNTVVLDITASTSNPTVAATIVDATVQSLKRSVLELAPKTAKGDTTVSIRTIEPPAVAISPSSPNTLVNTLAGLVLGIAVALIAIVIRQLFASRVRPVADLQRVVDAPLLGEIAADRSPDPVLALLRGTGSPTAESYRTLRASLAHEASDQGPTSILVTSAAESGDSSAISANLALAFREAGNRVALVDADLRTPTLAETAGVEAEPGVAEILSSNIRFSRVVRKRALGLVDLVPAHTVDNPTGVLVKGNLPQLLTALRKDYDSIIINTHATSSASDAAVLAPFVDGVLVVADRAVVKSADLGGALATLRRAGATVTGVVLAEKSPVSARAAVGRLVGSLTGRKSGSSYRVTTTSGESAPRSTVTVTESDASSATPNT